MSKTPLEIYVHIPFCVRKCLYCDFLSGPADAAAQEAYVQALLREIEAAGHPEPIYGKSFSSDDKRVTEDAGKPEKLWAENENPASYEVVSVFIGGGTPSIIKAEYIAEILSQLKKQFIFSPDTEITIEANPGTVTFEKLAAYRRAGVNRLSLGLQSAISRELKCLGRIHTYEEFLESFGYARKNGFDNINVDLMFALPGQTNEDWLYSLRAAAELGPEHISAYSLIIEDGTPFGEHTPELPDEETEYRMYEDTAELLQKYGYRQYEISNYAKPGYACRHNTGYWQGKEYLGFGLGAASLYQGVRFSNTREMQEYIEESGNPDKIRKEPVRLTRQNQMEEFMFLGLRMTDGVSEQEFLRRFGCSMESIYGPVLKKYQDMGLLQYKEERWSFTREGIHVSNPVLADFLL